jgi:hypothetical protein
MKLRIVRAEESLARTEQFYFIAPSARMSTLSDFPDKRITLLRFCQQGWLLRRGTDNKG